MVRAAASGRCHLPDGASAETVITEGYPSPRIAEQIWFCSGFDNKFFFVSLPLFFFICLRFLVADQTTPSKALVTQEALHP